MAADKVDRPTRDRQPTLQTVPDGPGARGPVLGQWSVLGGTCPAGESTYRSEVPPYLTRRRIQGRAPALAARAGQEAREDTVPRAVPPCKQRSPARTSDDDDDDDDDEEKDEKDSWKDGRRRRRRIRGHCFDLRFTIRASGL
ncbi:hypothetical protein CDD80_7548 [Ophiocordyceps camponoti-rufipedis]|uniref:Uncharacterized protein n=1 Tax=Ophiocordyceps camponoti-rufipedis TaxID=2004952 RepID=A0A2C5YMZ5_9HYPO|nr:hypothetical protein CDD80_7548 [Ophiocordyceps camponoti-rufipedis]